MTRQWFIDAIRSELDCYAEVADLDGSARLTELSRLERLWIVAEELAEAAEVEGVRS